MPQSGGSATLLYWLGRPKGLPTLAAIRFVRTFRRIALQPLLCLRLSNPNTGNTPASSSNIEASGVVTNDMLYPEKFGWYEKNGLVARLTAMKSSPVGQKADIVLKPVLVFGE